MMAVRHADDAPIGQPGRLFRNALRTVTIERTVRLSQSLEDAR